jgi:dolichol kinase
MIRSHEAAGKLTGASFILMSVCLSVLLFPKPIAVCALSFIIVGDTFAAIIGRPWGKHRFGDKSIEGSLGCFAGALLVACFAPGIPLAIGIPGAVVATLVEAAPIKLDDNITVPLASGLVMLLLHNVLTRF